MSSGSGIGAGLARPGYGALREAAESSPPPPQTLKKDGLVERRRGV